MTSELTNSPISEIISFIEARTVVKYDANGLSKEARVSFADLFDGDQTKAFSFAGTRGQLAHKIIDRMIDEIINEQHGADHWFQDLRRAIERIL